MESRATRRPTAGAIVAALATLCAAISSGAQAATVTSLDPNSIASALQSAGYKAKLSKDKDGDPSIESAGGGNDVKLVFFGCANGKACNQIEFVSVWNCEDDLKKCIQTAAKWNSSENYAHAIMVEKSIALYYHLMFDANGISDELFIRNFEQFSNDASGLMKMFGEVAGK